MKVFIILLALFIVCTENNQDELNDYDFVLYEDLEFSSEEYEDKLNQDGVWILWDTDRDGVPDKAVFGGYDQNGPTFVIKATIKLKSGERVGKIIGKYSPKIKKALVGYNGVEYSVYKFLILILNSYIWSDKYSKNLLIPGGDGKNICRIQVMDGQYWVPGKLDANRKYCTVSYESNEIFSPIYEALTRTC